MSAAAQGAPDRKTLEMLACPLTKTQLVLSADGGELISLVAGLAFPIRHGVPLMVPDAARKMDSEEIEALRRRSSDS